MYDSHMMPSQTPIMQYVRDMEQKVRTLQAAKDKIERPVFWKGFVWGAGIAAVLAWYLLHHA